MAKIAYLGIAAWAVFQPGGNPSQSKKEGQAGMWDWFWQAATAAATWLAGETGSRMVAGAAGGLMRWADQAQRRLRDGILAAVSGSFAAIYLGPLVKGFLLVVGVDLGNDTQGSLAAGFLAGLMGMSVAKVAIAVMETWAAQRRRGGDHDQT